jgi:hypothetical protein
VKESVIRPELDRLAKDRGWFLLERADGVPGSVYDDGYLVAAVGWSEWDGWALNALAAYLSESPGTAVAVFNADDMDAQGMASRIPGLPSLPQAVPVVVHYVGGHLVRVEEGMSAVEWMRGLAEG